MLETMNWQEFISKLLRDFRLSSPEFETKTGVSNVTVSNLKTGQTKSPSQNTIKKIEKSLDIVIDDSNPDHITYKRLSNKNELEAIVKTRNEYPLIREVFAGESPMLFIQENISDYVPFYYSKKEGCFAVRVVGDSMNGTITEGDLVLIDMDLDIQNGKLVVARFKDGKQVIKRYKSLPNNMVMLYSDNNNYEPITVPETEIEAIFRVAAIQRFTF
jgi:SOS-response transcriptional repressor LexA